MSEVKHPKGNTVITQDYHVLSAHGQFHIPGCICALDLYYTLFAVVHEDGRTKILRVSTEGTRTILERDYLIDIINISQYEGSPNFEYIFSTSEGVRFVFNESGERLKIPDYIPRDTVGAMNEYLVNYDGEVTKTGSGVITRINGYRCENVDDFTGWTDHKILDFDAESSEVLTRFNYHRYIDDVHAEKSEVDIVMILSGETIYVKGMNRNGDKVIESQRLRGTWLSAPFYLDGDKYAIDSNGILRDIRSAWVDKNEYYDIHIDRYDADIDPEMLHSTEPSLFEQGIKPGRYSIGKYHGMKVLNTRYKMIKSARSMG